MLTPLTQRSHDTNEQKNHNELDGVLDGASDGNTLYAMSTLSSQNLTDVGVGNSPGNLGNTKGKANTEATNDGIKNLLRPPESCWKHRASQSRGRLRLGILVAGGC